MLFISLTMQTAYVELEENNLRNTNLFDFTVKLDKKFSYFQKTKTLFFSSYHAEFNRVLIRKFCYVAAQKIFVSLLLFLRRVFNL